MHIIVPPINCLSELRDYKAVEHKRKGNTLASNRIKSGKTFLSSYSPKGGEKGFLIDTPDRDIH